MMHRVGWMLLLAAGAACADACRWDVREDPAAAESLLVDVAIQAPEFVDEGGALKPTIDGLSAIGKPGAPDLPKAVKLLPVPEGRFPRVEVLSIDSSVTNGVLVMPCPTPRVVESEEGKRVDTTDRAKDDAIYGNPEAWPAEPVLCETAMMGTQTWARLVVHPMQYEPVSGIFIWHTNVTLRIWWEKSPES